MGRSLVDGVDVAVLEDDIGRRCDGVRSYRDAEMGNSKAERQEE